MPDQKSIAPTEPAAGKSIVGRSFRPAAAILEEEEPPRITQWVLYSCFAFLVIAVIWAYFARIDETVVARGELFTAVPTLVVQPLERVPIKAVHVKVGDVVRKGQLLASLDPTFTEADIEQLKTKLAASGARQRRLEAELAGTDYSPSANAGAAEQLEASLFQERKRTYAARMRAYEEDLARVSSTLDATRADMEKTVMRAGLLRKVLEMRRALTEKAITSELQFLEAQAQLLSVERENVQAEGKIAEASHQAESIRAQRDAYAQEWREKVADELVTIRRDHEVATEELTKTMRRHDMVSLTAPQDAIVLEIAQRSIGSVLREAEILFTLVPLDAPLEGEVRISPRDVGLIRAGNDVRIKFDAFPFQKYGTAKGKVMTISPDTFRPQRGSGADASRSEENGTFYKARISLTDVTMRDGPANFRLLPGMTISAEIRIGERTIMSYLLYPIIKGLDESLHEPR